MNEGEALTGTVGAAIDGDAEYTLVKDGGEALEPEKLTETETFTVDVTADGAGSISGGGSFHTGEWAGLTAVPMDGESFVGWYDGENLLTDEPVLRFAVNKDMEITAKFTDELCDVTFVSDGNVLAVQRVNKGETVDLSAVSPSYGCVIEGFYLDEGMRNPMKATYVFSGDATVYVKQVERTEPGISYIGAASHEGVLTLSIETEMIPDTADVYAAMYADDGQMIAAKKVTLENGSGELSVEAGECADVKVYIWDSEIKMSPLCKAAESKVIKL